MAVPLFLWVFMDVDSCLSLLMDIHSTLPFHRGKDGTGMFIEAQTGTSFRME